jgi:hypothetical protein
MIVVIKNFMRNVDCNLVALSVKYFLPESKIYLLNFYNNEINHDNLQLNLYYEILDVETKYVLGPGYKSRNNGYYYTEALNITQKYFNNIDEKLLFLDENHFFTNGETLKEITENNFDIAYCYWNNNMPNASCLCINPFKISFLFPLPEYEEYIEEILKKFLIDIDSKITYYLIKNRNFVNYFNDGCYTNDTDEMRKMMIENGII